MSSVEDGEMKAGHLPAVKAGGMRIIQHKLPREEREVKPTKESEESKVSTSPPKTLLISGFPAKGNADFPPEALQKFHDKPMPTHEPPRHTNNSRPVIIQQPRK